MLRKLAAFLFLVFPLFLVQGQSTYAWSSRMVVGPHAQGSPGCTPDRQQNAGIISTSRRIRTDGESVRICASDGRFQSARESPFLTLRKSSGASGNRTETSINVDSRWDCDGPSTTLQANPATA